MNQSIDRPLWCDADGLRIWRSPDSDFYGDEIRRAPIVYTDEVFEGIAAAGFNAVWLRGKLRDLCRSSIFPELNRDDADERVASLREVIARGQRYGVKVFLFFNEPLAVSADDPFWQKYSGVAGQRHRDYGEKHDVLSLCTKTEPVQRYLRESTSALFREAAGLGGVILITASEYHTHCWSHHALYSLNDGLQQIGPSTIECPRCRDRSPAEIVGELATIWRDAAQRYSSSPQVLCWNWSWSMWYPDPQAEIFDHLPDGIEVLLDCERGTDVKRRGQTLDVDEYSLSVIGPGERFCESKRVAEQYGYPVNAKMQLGTTHEIATVPNLPLLENLHAKLLQLTNQRVAGIMGTWNFGCSLTLNTAAISLYCQDPDQFADTNVFLNELARGYLGTGDTASVRLAWKAFGEAFDHYPFATAFLYLSPLNYAPAYPLRLRYEARPMGASWLAHDWGDRLNDSLPADMSVAEVADALNDVASRWHEGLVCYAQALESPGNDELHRTHRVEELSCARMIEVQIGCCANIYHFHAWREARMEELGLAVPCDIPLNEDGREILEREYELSRKARELCLRDDRLGRHQECQAYLYNAGTVAFKMKHLRKMLDPCVSDP